MEFDFETGLHYNVNRYYDPHLGRYLSPDPPGLAPAANHYAYVPNLFTLIDPLGLAGCTADPSWGGKVVWVRDEHGRPHRDLRPRTLRELPLGLRSLSHIGARQPHGTCIRAYSGSDALRPRSGNLPVTW
ncbi:RHS repeat-associated core domain-containing protein [Streptomyces sp. NPDC005727]|uniref:RHS repeat-associated core domain-containing protein n=1 Tax=Streptomyces sp. NPDC005727 TaxID=3157053 RepID=UPI0033EBBAB9